MGLLQKWREVAYSQETDKKELQKFWTDYFLIEKGIYEKLLANPDEVVKGTVKELAEKYEIPVMTMVGFLDGIDESLRVPRKSFTKIWWTPRRTGCTICLPGTTFLTRRRGRFCTGRPRRRIRW